MFALLLVAPPAIAKTYEVEIVVPQSSGAYSPGGSYRAGRLFPGLAEGHPDITVTTESPWITCSIKDGTIGVMLGFDTDVWPNLPASADCVYGDDVLRVIPVIHPPWTAWIESDRYIVPPEPLVVPRARGWGGYRWYVLPDGHPYTAALVDARLRTDEPWTGVSCQVAPSADQSVWWLKVDIHEDAPFGQGGCELPNPSGLPYRLKLDVIATD